MLSMHLFNPYTRGGRLRGGIGTTAMPLHIYPDVVIIGRYSDQVKG